MNFKEVVETYYNPPNFKGFFIHSRIKFRNVRTRKTNKPCAICDGMTKKATYNIFGGIVLCSGHMKMLNQRIRSERIK